MALFAYYLLKVSLVSALLYTYYFLVLRNKKLHRYNRFYLLTVVFLSLVIPLVRINFAERSTQEAGAIKLLYVLNNPGVYAKTTTIQSTFLSYYNQIALPVFLLVTAFALCILILRISRIFLLIKTSPKKLHNNICFVFAKSHCTPFSFFTYIFWNENINMDSEDGKHILQHELTHVKQYHSADKLFLNFVLTVFWINPFFWIIRKELNMLQEFLADQKAIANGDANAFATMLLTATYPQHYFALANSFFHSPVKRRLLMLTVQKAASYSYLRRLMILPLLSLMSVLPAFKIEAKNTEELQRSQRSDKNTNQQEFFNEATESYSDTIEAKFPGGNEAWKKYLETDLDANAPVVNDKAPAGDYTVKLQFIVTETGEIKDISAVKVPDHCPSCAMEAVRIIKKEPRWDPNDNRWEKCNFSPNSIYQFSCN